MPGRGVPDRLFGGSETRAKKEVRTCVCVRCCEVSTAPHLVLPLSQLSRHGLTVLCTSRHEHVCAHVHTGSRSEADAHTTLQ